ncbi:MAG: DUF4065 domain-containing protein [Methanobrevibacter sp.]|jgi:uncharacterized phage-associated protein|nr:DUF4065 domain-containing protein [Candidatus Methanoflexus mossambicus]
MWYNSSTIASYFIRKSEKIGKDISILKVIKLVYIAHGWKLALDNTPLINDEIQAWKYGPVMPELFNLLNKEEDNKKTSSAKISDPNIIAQSLIMEDKDILLLNRVFIKYMDFSDEEISELCHEKDTPWNKIYNNGKGRNEVISDKETSQYYKTQITKEEYNLLKQFLPIKTKQEAEKLLKDAGIMLKDGSMNPIYL